MCKDENLQNLENQTKYHLQQMCWALNMQRYEEIHTR